MISGLLYQKTTRTPNASQKNDSGELSWKGFRVQGSRFYRFNGNGAAHFVILSGEKRRMLKNGLSETGELSRRI